LNVISESYESLKAIVRSGGQRNSRPENRISLDQR